jgi:energy-coupling factor transporter ATP-binding protein EcfA2
MWLEELRLENIRCFESIVLKFARTNDAPYPWVTLLGENGGGKSTVLQTLGLLLSGPEGAQKLLPRPLGWLRNEHQSGNGAFRRLTRSNQIIVPSLEPQARYTNFSTQFDEGEPLSIFERWMVYLDYRIAKEDDTESRRLRDLGVSAIDRLLPDGVTFDSVTSEGRILLDVQGEKIPTIALSDGYRSVLALVGDLVWRLFLAFPQSIDPFQEEGVVLIDELDIHLHPLWQRDIAGVLRKQFPRLQFIVATHSPLVAAGAGEDAMTFRFLPEKRGVKVERVPDVSAMNVDRILQSDAFGLISPYSPQTQEKIDRYDHLTNIEKRTTDQEKEFQLLLDFMEEARPLGGCALSPFASGTPLGTRHLHPGAC